MVSSKAVSIHTSKQIPKFVLRGFLASVLYLLFINSSQDTEFIEVVTEFLYDIEFVSLNIVGYISALDISYHLLISPLQ